MKKNLMGAVLLALCFVMMASFSVAAPVSCVSLIGGGADNTDPGGNSTSIDCFAGGLEFTNFAYTVVSGSGVPDIDLSAVTVVNGLVSLTFNPNLTFPSIISDLHFVFTVQTCTAAAVSAGCVLNGNILGATLLDPNGGGVNSSIAEGNCTGIGGIDVNTGACAPGAVAIWNTNVNDNQNTSCIGNVAGGNGTTTLCAYGAGQAGVSVFKDLAVVVGSGHQSSFTEGFQAGVPEPMTFSLLGAGLLGLGLLRRKLKK